MVIVWRLLTFLIAFVPYYLYYLFLKLLYFRRAILESLVGLDLNWVSAPPQVQGRGILEQSSGSGHPSVDSHRDCVYLGAGILPGCTWGNWLWHSQLQLQEPNPTHLHAQPQGWLHVGKLSSSSYHFWTRKFTLNGFVCQCFSCI